MTNGLTEERFEIIVKWHKDSTLESQRPLPKSTLTYTKLLKKEHTTPEIDKFKIEALENIINFK
ncbi:hypothetical protein [uncultured Wocania sp.]|uniref:hypothetical protein n=1 Tax=uncultured Wocania sp. TaxID=2834404 RepID=UPI0030F51B01